MSFIDRSLGNVIMKKHYDVVVIGDGPAGASTAVFLAQRNQDVLLLARQVRPSEKVGENLSPQANPVLKELGVNIEISAKMASLDPFCRRISKSVPLPKEILKKKK